MLLLSMNSVNALADLLEALIFNNFVTDRQREETA